MSDEAADQPGTNEEVQQPTIEEIAAQQGWKADHEGPDKIGAQEFINRKPLFDKIKAQNRELKEVKKLVEGMANTYKSMSDAQYRKGIADAAQKMKDAEDAYDVKAFKEASNEKAALETAQAATVTAIPAADQSLIDAFCEKNTWFDTNKIMRTDALDYREKFVKRNPDASTQEVLEYVETKMKKDYPESFEPAPNTRRPAVSAVEGASTASHADPLNKLKASMSAEEKRIMGMFTKNGNMTEKEYLESYSQVRER
jgi:hypothetical protein